MIHPKLTLRVCSTWNIVCWPLLALLAVGGCAALSKRTDTRPPPASSPSNQPVPLSATQADQQGVLNAALGSIAVTGIAVTQVMPLGLIPLMAFNIWLSHRREMARLKRNGSNCSPESKP